MIKEKVIITGGSGLVGGQLKKILPEGIFLSSKDFNLTKETEVVSMYESLKPDVIVHLAARVGGILDNINRPAEYFLDNVKMNTLLVEYAYKYNVKKFIGVLSSCIYPDTSERYPLLEEDLHSGPPTQTNFSYGYAKRALAVQIDAFNKQYKTNYQYLIPCNLFGENDKDNEAHSHFVTALIKKIKNAVINGDKHITLFGDGTPLRQFIHALDFAKIIYFILKGNILGNYNVCGEENLSIKEIAEIALKACDAQHLEIKWDTSKPNGQYRKDMSQEKLKKVLPFFKYTSLYQGIKDTYNFNYGKIS